MQRYIKNVKKPNIPLEKVIFSHILDMGWIYLIGEENKPNNYKIGSTRGKTVNGRMKQLQTGNSSSLFIRHSFETDTPFKLEKMLHTHFKNDNIINEWFELSEDDIAKFIPLCEKLQDNITALSDNPFFFKK